MGLVHSRWSRVTGKDNNTLWLTWGLNYYINVWTVREWNYHKISIYFMQKTARIYSHSFYMNLCWMLQWKAVFQTTKQLQPVINMTKREIDHFLQKYLCFKITGRNMCSFIFFQVKKKVNLIHLCIKLLPGIFVWGNSFFVFSEGCISQTSD